MSCADRCFSAADAVTDRAQRVPRGHVIAASGSIAGTPLGIPVGGSFDALVSERGSRSDPPL